MSETSKTLDAVCPHCQAAVQADATRCWLCEQSLDGLNVAPARSPGAPSHRGASFSLSTMLLITTLIAICCGLLAAAPGLGVIVCVLLAPVLVRTAKVVRRREKAGVRVSSSEKIGLAATSFVVAMVLATVVGFAAFCCFCAVCAFAFGADSNEPGLILLGFCVGVVGLLSIWGVVKLVQWSRRRYLRDIEARP
jgi:hypothetical protein